MKTMFLILTISFAALSPSQVFAQDDNEASKLFDEAKKHFDKAEYKEAIVIYDTILELIPYNISTLKMKGIALSNLGQDENSLSYHQSSLKQFYRILQHDPNDVIALAGMGVGFGYLGEYQESKQYFQKAFEVKPNSVVITNYVEFIDSVIQKYPYTPTEKPNPISLKLTFIPTWVKNNAGWWGVGIIGDSDFITGIKYLIENDIIVIDPPESSGLTSEPIPIWIKNNAKWWAADQISNEDFLSGIFFMIQNGIMIIQMEQSLEDLEKKRLDDFKLFETYLREISKNVTEEKRYIEFPNPSFDVIKKFLRDYIKWNFDQEVQSAAEHFPDPTNEIVDGTYVIHYKIFVNEQPTGLPLDHVSTFNNSIKFWEQTVFTGNDQNARVVFSYTNLKSEANVWVTWVVRDLGEGVLGHAHLGKGVVEVALGDYTCDGSFQLYDVSTVNKIMTHELGHSIGLQHSDDPNSIMFTSLKPNYAYCLLS
ncbi:MAG: TPR repeat-containing protein [Nitrosopumilales archaeon]|nr:MAG: TPR repeat-containing protein [Nitrosopumilales archaeon]